MEQIIYSEPTLFQLIKKYHDIYSNRKYAVLATGLYAHANPSSQTQLRL